MPRAQKYAPLQQRLAQADGRSLTLSFAEIEETIGAKLPTSARKHQAWWANNPNGHSHCRAWIAVGWRTGNLNIAEEKVDFVQVSPQAEASQPSSDAASPANAGASSGEPAAAPAASANAQAGSADAPPASPRPLPPVRRAGPVPDPFGALAGTVTIHDPTALTAPTGERWQAAGTSQ